MRIFVAEFGWSLPFFPYSIVSFFFPIYIFGTHYLDPPFFFSPLHLYACVCNEWIVLFLLFSRFSSSLYLLILWFISNFE
mmetsp:Transcript_8310/g.22071  ORF Transcript_8310/g.22071 Transcript_8310/m.22071 type:complete len:80 (-) Transcript_8310:22-261(-)